MMRASGAALEEALALANPDGRVRAVIGRDLDRLETAQPQWKERIAAYRSLLGPPAN